MNTVAGWAIGERRPAVRPVPLVLLISPESHFELDVKFHLERAVKGGPPQSGSNGLNRAGRLELRDLVVTVTQLYKQLSRVAA